MILLLKDVNHNMLVIYGHTCKIYEMQVVPYLTTNQDVNSEGQIILPDGSGAIISFNSVKDAQNAKTYSKQIYGDDSTLPRENRGSDVEDHSAWHVWIP